ncbi:hypothetical protein IC575_027320 [Cucumis melo]|uniref:Uncharacterized protein LOC103497999 n=1 Tax=Cucumis melo TaxID=3656 RepID=A0A1S3C8E4_CUCME|nr:uncharacterized protein LOC103497999 [Cucumis melo]
MTLPRFVGFQSVRGSYLSYIDDGQTLAYISDDLIASRNKFALDPASNGEDDVFNIRCCYNGKYWMPELKVDGYSTFILVVAKASQPNENESDRTSTLFKFVLQEIGRYDIIHVSTGLFVTRDFSDNFLALYPEDMGTLHEHWVLDWEGVVLLPKYIVFKGDNGLYLRGHSQDGYPYLRFSSSDPYSHPVGNEVFRMSDGKVRIKSLYWGKFWRCTGSWIWADSTDTSANNHYTLFTPVQVSDNVIALKNLGEGTQFFVKRLSIDYKESCLAAKEITINKYCEMEISEYVSSRSIYNVKFRLKDSRIYGETIEVAATQDATNDTSGYLTQTLSLAYTDEVTNTWNNTIEMKLGFGLEFSGGIPLITSAGITVSGEISGSYSWGETLTKKTSKESSYQTIVPPKTRVKVSLIASKGKCDIPFSYMQRDVYSDGTVKIEEHDDGIYTGLNCYSYNYEVEEQKI